MSVNAPTRTFEGFRREAIEFLAQLAANNERSWFQPRKAEYERLLKEPLEALCVALDAEFRARAIPLRADPARSPFRIYRDVRFSKDKSPYKTGVAAAFAWIGGPDGAPGERPESEHRGGGAYFHLEPGNIFAGGGIWHPEAGRLAAWRQLVATDPARVHGALDDPAFTAEFGTVDGERSKRVPVGFAQDHPEAELLKLKDVTFGRRLSDEEAMSPELPATLARSYAAAVPLMRLLAALPAS